MTTTETILAALAGIGGKMEGLSKRENAEFGYHGLADAVYWDDEIPNDLSEDADNGLRFILRYRTTVLLGEPDAQWARFWEKGKASFPDWIGFSPDRIAPNDAISEFYKESAGVFSDDIDKLIDM